MRETVTITGNGRWKNLSQDERARQIAQEEEAARIYYSSSGNKTSFSILKDNVGNGIGNLGRGISNTVKGIIETAVGLVKETDAVALGLGAIAIMAVGTVVSPVPALLSREKNIIDVNRDVFASAKTPINARLVGYPLLALAGGFGIQQAAKMFK